MNENTSGFASPADGEPDRTSPDECEALKKCDECGTYYVKGHDSEQCSDGERRPTVGRMNMTKRIALLNAAEDGDPTETVVYSTNRRAHTFHRVVRDENGLPTPACGTKPLHDSSRWKADTRGNQESVLRRYPCTEPECFDIDVDEALE